MARRAFFTFNYGRDIWRVNIVRNAWKVAGVNEIGGWYDASIWEDAKSKGDAAIKRLINEGMKGSSVDVVLIGAETAGRKYVDYEIARARELGKGIVGLRIHGLKNVTGKTDPAGRNPLDDHTAPGFLWDVRFSSLYKTYDYIWDNGYANLGRWIEEAAAAAGR